MTKAQAIQLLRVALKVIPETNTAHMKISRNLRIHDVRAKRRAEQILETASWQSDVVLHDGKKYYAGYLKYQKHEANVRETEQGDFIWWVDPHNDDIVTGPRELTDAEAKEQALQCLSDFLPELK